eukprot:14149168-Alexandrium_andersonii.AAC.1
MGSCSLNACGRTWVLDQAYMESLHTVEGKRILDESALRCLPAAAPWVTLPQAAQQLEALSHSTLYKLVNHDGKSFCDAMLEVVKCMSLGSPPSSAAFQHTAELRDAWVRLQNFCQHCPKGGSGDPLVGKAALVAAMDDLKSSQKEGTPITFKELELFHVFPHLLDPAEREWVEGITKEILA